MAISGNVTVKVTPEVLKQKAAEVSQQIRVLDSLFKQLESKVNGTRSYWVGEAGEMHRRAYIEEKKNIERMLRRLSEHPDDLLLISGNYEAGERQNVAKAQVLNENAIF